MKRRVTPAEPDEKETDGDARTPLDSDRDTPSGRVPRVCTRVRVRVHPVRHGPALQETACCAVGPVRRRWAFSGFCFCSWGPCECSSSLSKSGARRERAALGRCLSGSPSSSRPAGRRQGHAVALWGPDHARLSHPLRLLSSRPELG